jgi:RNA polymerase sigma-70 factor (ECF subfamily)
VILEDSDSTALLRLAQAGDADAYCDLCQIHETRLLRQAMILSRNESLAEDLTQDTLVEAWKCLRRYNGHCQFFTWLCAILLNRYRNTLRQKRPTPFSSLGSGDATDFQTALDTLAVSQSGPDEAALASERAVQVMDCIRSLPSEQREVIYLRFYVDNSLESIAEAMGCSIGTVKSRLFRALDKLRSMEALNPKLETTKNQIVSL